MTLDRLFRPKSIAVIGGGYWTEAVICRNREAGFQGELFAIHPKADTVAGLKAYRGAPDLPTPPDAVFIGINRAATVGAVERLSRLGAGGAVCFASGFSEARENDPAGVDLESRLLKAAGDMPILGPNCYGFINNLDGVMLWPDWHGLEPVSEGVAILTQSSNIALNITMQNRALPVGYVVTCGNMTQTSQAQIALSLLDDDRVTAVGVHIEGFSDLRMWEAFAAKAQAKNIPVVALKVGRSAAAKAATASHTASMAGADAGAQALLDRLGIARVDTIPEFLETLKLMHGVGRLPSTSIGSISCSGGEAGLMADLGQLAGIDFPPLNPRQTKGLANALGSKVTLANPLDYHTYIWRDAAAMGAVFSSVPDPDLALTLVVLDYPRADRADPRDWDIATKALLEARKTTGQPMAVVASLPELMPEDTAKEFLAGGIVPMQGLAEALVAVRAAASKTYDPTPILLPGPEQEADTISEEDAKRRLVAAGVVAPKSSVGAGAEGAADATDGLAFPVALKVLGLVHKTDSGGLALNLQSRQEVEAAARTMPDGAFMVEEMVTGVRAELLVGILKDPAHGFVLTLAAGGVLTELLKDQVSLLVPASRDAVKSALLRLKAGHIFRGYRGAKPVDPGPILDAIEAVQQFVITNAKTIDEVEVNPFLVTESAAIAVDALIREVK